MVELLTGVHRKRWRFFSVKRTPPEKADTTPFQLDAFANNLYDIGPFFDMRSNVVPCTANSHSPTHEKYQVNVINNDTILPKLTGRHLFARNNPPNHRYIWFFDMEDFINAFAHEVKLEIANRYFGFRTRIESEIQDYLARLHDVDGKIAAGVRRDLLRMRFLLHRERLFQAFLLFTGLPEGLTEDESGRQASSRPEELFAEMKGEGLTRWRRYRDLAFRVYLSLVDNITAYREAYLDLTKEYQEICTRINDFHRNNDLTGILSFLQTFDTATAERLRFLHAEPYHRPGIYLDQDLRIAPPCPVESLLPDLAAVPPLKQARKPLTPLLETAFACHRPSRQESPF